MTRQRRGTVWNSDLGWMLVVSSTVYNDLPSEPTVLTMPVYEQEPETGFGVSTDAGWAMPNLIFPLAKSRLHDMTGELSTQALTDVNTMLFKIIGTPG